MNVLPPVVWSLEDAVKAFLDHGFKDGDLISKEWLTWALDLPENATPAAQLVIMDRMDQFKHALLVGHCIYIVSDRGKGYRIVPPSDQAFVSVTVAMKEVKRQFNKCSKILEHTRTEELTTDEARRHTDAQLKISALAGMVGRERRDVFKMFEKRTEP